MRPTNEEISEIKKRLPMGAVKKITEAMIKDGVAFNVKSAYQLVSRTLLGFIGFKAIRAECWDERHDAVIAYAKRFIANPW